MKNTDPINCVSYALHSACLVDLAPVQYRFLTPKQRREGVAEQDVPLQTRRPSPYDIQRVELWQQTWGSTALGFGGMGGASMTTADVVVVTSNEGDACVYFGGQLAYHINRPSDTFWQDVAARQMKNVAEAGAYERAE